MDMVTLISILLTLSAAFAYLNFRFVGLPTTIGVMVMSLVFSMGALALERLGLVDAYSFAENLLSRIDFNETLMEGMLSFLLFAGALHVSTKDLVKIKWTIASLATFGVIISTFVVGSLTFALLGFLGFHYLASGQFSPHKWAGFAGSSALMLALFVFLMALIGDMLNRHRIYLEELLYRERERSKPGERDA